MSERILNVDPKLIRMPSNYVRGPKGFNEEWAAELAEVAKQSDSGWPFDPLIVFTIKDDKKGRKWEVADGAHRLWAAIKRKRDTIPVSVKTYDSPADAFMDQLVMTMKGGRLKLDLDARDSAIRQLVLHFKMDRKKVMDLTGLSEGSVSRIVNEKQKTAAERGKRRKGGRKVRKATRSGQGGNGFAPLDWYSGLAALLESFKENGDAIVRARGEVEPGLLTASFNMVGGIINGAVPEELRPKTAEPVGATS